ncbi:unnamed protein product [Prunus armeniaca]
MEKGLYGITNSQLNSEHATWTLYVMNDENTLNEKRGKAKGLHKPPIPPWVEEISLRPRPKKTYVARLVSRQQPQLAEHGSRNVDSGEEECSTTVHCSIKHMHQQVSP